MSEATFWRMEAERHTRTSEDRQPDGEWCWCGYPPEGQAPHDCAEDHPGRRHQHDGAHVHPTESALWVLVWSEPYPATAVLAPTASMARTA